MLLDNTMYSDSLIYIVNSSREKKKSLTGTAPSVQPSQQFWSPDPVGFNDSPGWLQKFRWDPVVETGRWRVPRCHAGFLRRLYGVQR